MARRRRPHPSTCLYRGARVTTTARAVMTGGWLPGVELLTRVYETPTGHRLGRCWCCWRAWSWRATVGLTLRDMRCPACGTALHTTSSQVKEGILVLTPYWRDRVHEAVTGGQGIGPTVTPRASPRPLPGRSTGTTAILDGPTPEAPTTAAV